ncbi:PHD and RING finger domain-containing protein 1 isoform X1 [Clarias magur]|uniref:PHD and RING finger domain-containing protein 1 isoform X1 n=1 Tax=Clarias magur TaxID=1594786 RepID=A0A8J4TS72_CLAMG|nr:PHD and RING finger domain-containing protein 1 isoform X1 [Clarias magur]
MPSSTMSPQVVEKKTPHGHIAQNLGLRKPSHRQECNANRVEKEDEAEASPDLLGSILGSQSLLLKDFTNAVVNKDGSLTFPKHELCTLKLKQEGSCKTASSSTMQITCQVAVAAHGVSKSAAVSISSPALEGMLNAFKEKCKSHNEEMVQNLKKDKYMKKLQMQEWAIENVKQALKPFYQKRDITKEEYKEIFQKSVKKTAVAAWSCPNQQR